jgi:hypothetical protein
MVTLDTKTVRAGQYVDTAHVDTLLRNYKKERWVHNSQRIGKEDSLSVWFSMDKIEAFLASAKENGADGVKFYFGAYPSDYAEIPEYAGRQTIAMVATKARTSATGGTVNKDVYITRAGVSTIMGFNVGTMCPPCCGFNGGSGGDLGITIIDRGEGMEII